MWARSQQGMAGANSQAKQWGLSTRARAILVGVLFLASLVFTPAMLRDFATAASNQLGTPLILAYFTQSIPLPLQFRETFALALHNSIFQWTLILAGMWVLVGPGIKGEMGLYPPMAGGVTDQAVDSANEDTLNRAPVAKALRSLLQNPRSEAPFTVAITAPWGSGKTSVLNMLHSLVRDNMSVIRLNPWHFKEDDHLLASLLESMRSEAIPAGLTWRNLRFRFRLFWLRSAGPITAWLAALAALAIGLTLIHRMPDTDQFKQTLSYGYDELRSALRELLPSLGVAQDSVHRYETGILGLGLLIPLATALKELKNRVSVLSPTFRRMMRHVSAGWKEKPGAEWAKHAGLRYQFQQDFTLLCAALGKGGWFNRRRIQSRIVLIIDDLDRCEPGQIESAVASLNFLFSTPAPCFAVVGMDWERTVTALGHHFRDIAIADDASNPEPYAASRGYAERYLEKIIQLRIELSRENVSPATIVAVPPKQALRVINWWALPERTFESACRIALLALQGLARLAARGGEKLLGLVRRGLLRLRSSPPVLTTAPNPQVGYQHRYMAVGKFKLFATIGLMLGAAAIGPAWAAYTLNLGGNLPDMMMMMGFLTESLLALSCLGVGAILIFRRDWIIKPIGAKLDNAPPSIALMPILLPLLLYLYLSDGSPIVGTFILYLVLVITQVISTGENGRAKRSAAAMSDLAGGWTTILLVVVLWPDSTGAISTAWAIAALYCFGCTFERSNKFPAGRLTLHLSQRTSLIFEAVAKTTSLCLRLLGSVRFSNFAVPALLLCAILWIAAQAPASVHMGLESAGGHVASSLPSTTAILPNSVPQTDAWQVSLTIALLEIVKGLCFITFPILVLIWAYRAGYLDEFLMLFLRDHMIQFESVLDRWGPHLQDLALSPRAKKQLINRSRYVVNRWHVECDSLQFKWASFSAHVERRLRQWLNGEHWEVKSTAVPMNADLLSNLTLLNSLTFGRLLADDAHYASSIIRKHKLEGELAAVVSVIGERTANTDSLPFRQFSLWKGYEETLPFPVSWRGAPLHPFCL